MAIPALLVEAMAIPALLVEAMVIPTIPVVGITMGLLTNLPQGINGMDSHFNIRSIILLDHMLERKTMKPVQQRRLLPSLPSLPNRRT